MGIGEDGVEGLGAEAKRRIAQAEFVFGGRRHLDLVTGLVRGETRAWPTPFDSTMGAVTALSGRSVCVLASGDPFCHGVGSTLARHVPPAEMETLPAPSAFSLAASRLGWALPDVETISLHGREIERIRSLLSRGTRILALTSDHGGPPSVAALLTRLGFGPSRVTVLEALGGQSERIRSTRADAFDLADINPLNLLAIEVDSASQEAAMPLTPGLPDDAYEHDGQITKREIRALSLAALAPRRGELLWDVGAGSGSIAVEWMLGHPSLRAVAVEERADRAERVRRNALSLGVPQLTVVSGRAPEALAGLPSPDAVFVGGGGSEAGVMDAVVEALRPGGRLVANAVTLEMEQVLLARHAAQGGDLTRIALSRAAPVGSMQGWRLAMPVTQWSWVKR